MLFLLLIVSNLFYRGWVGAGSILKEAKKLYGPVHFFLGVRVHLLIPMKPIHLMIFKIRSLCLSVEPTPLDDTVFVAIHWLTSIGLGWFMFFI